MSSLGGLYGITTDTIDLVIKSSQAMIALSVVALVGGLIQANRYDTRHPYMLVCIAALCYLIQAALNNSLSSPAGPYTNVMPRLLAAYFFGPLFPILAWVLVLDIFRMVQPKTEGTSTWDILKRDLPGTLAGYIWAFILAICDAAYVGSMGSATLTQGTLLDAIHTSEVVTYGLWGFLPLYIYQQMKSWNVSHHFIGSFAVLVILVLLVTIGCTISQAIKMNGIDGSSAMASQVVDFVMSRIFGIIGLYWVIAFGHTWVHNEDTANSDGESFYDKYLLSPRAQVCLLGLVFLLGPGMSNALNRVATYYGPDSNVWDISYGLLYPCFALVGFIAGAVTNKLSVRWTLTV